MTQGPSHLRAPAEVQPEPALTPRFTPKAQFPYPGRCRDCGELLDVWNCCPNVPPDQARLQSSRSVPLNCGNASTKPWNFTVDMPGVGRVEMRDVAAETPAVLRGSPRVAGEMPPTLAKHLRDDLLLKLAFAAKNLADRNLIHRMGRDNVVFGHRCQECNQADLPNSAVRMTHNSSCWTGRVLDLIRELQASNDLQSQITRKEAAPAGPEDRAEDGIFPRGDFGEPWKLALDRVFGTVTIFDRDGVCVASFSKDRRDHAYRIVDCVNTLAANPAWDAVLPRNGGAR
jgi:hypothetical protein